MKELLKVVITEGQTNKLPEIKQRALSLEIDLPFIVSLIGARRSGKTYLLYALIEKLIQNGVARENILYLNFEDERLNLQVTDLDMILQSFFELHPNLKPENCWFLFDEIQNIEGWEKFVRRIFDTYSRHIYITGSNSRLLSTEIATSLRGRTLTYTVYPLNLKEYLIFRDVPLNLYQPQQKAAVVHHTLQFIKNGGFPEVINLEEDIRVKALQGYFNTMIFRDIVERYKIADPQLLKFFIKKLFASVGKPLSINKIYNELRSMGYKVSNNYLYDFESYCNSVFLTQSVLKFHYSEIKQEKSEKKSYPIDTGLLSAIEFSISENKGKLLENMVMLELMKQGNKVFYHKDKYECDFIANKDNFFNPVQVAWNIEQAETKEREIRGLVEACKKVKSKQGIIITFDTSDNFNTGDIDISVVPVYKYFLQEDR